MFPVPKVRQPRGFKADVELRGRTWLNAHPAATHSDYPDYWRTRGNGKYVRALKNGFHFRCGYTAHLTDHATVDHFYSKENYRKRTYKWSNYRYAASWLNSAKKPCHDGLLLDPYEVGPGWFEVELPSMQLVVNPAVIPTPELVAKARFTLDTLPICDDERVVDFRAMCYAEYKASHDKPTALQWLRRMAPLIAEAIERWEGANPGQPLP